MYLEHRLHRRQRQRRGQRAAYYCQGLASSRHAQEPGDKTERRACNQQSRQPFESRKRRRNVNTDVFFQNGQLPEIPSQSVRVNGHVQGLLIVILRGLKPHLPERQSEADQQQNGSEGGQRQRQHSVEPAVCDTAPVPASIANRGFNRMLPLALATFASILLLVSLRLPLWQMRLEAPQYRDQEALHVAVHPNALRGDLRELSVLEKYIGVHIPPTLPQFKWLPGLLVAGAALGFVARLLRVTARGKALAVISSALAAALALAAVQAMFQIHDIGHKRDQKTALVGVKDFTPPFIGTNKIAQFTVSSRLGLGAWLIGGALALQFGAAWRSRQPQARASALKQSPKGDVARLAPTASR